MSNADAVAVDLVAANGVIDDMEASTYVYGSEGLKFLAMYQVKLAAGRTKLDEDLRFLMYLTQYFVVKSQAA